MLKKINSIYFLEDIFSYLKEALILKIIKYNEDFRNKLFETLIIIEYIVAANIYYLIKIEKEKNIIVMEIYYLKENI